MVRSIHFARPGANSRRVQQSVSDRQEREWGFGHDEDGGGGLLGSMGRGCVTQWLNERGTEANRTV